MQLILGQDGAITSFLASGWYNGEVWSGTRCVVGWALFCSEGQEGCSAQTSMGSVLH